MTGLALDEELVVLVDGSGNPIGTTPKATVHTTETPFHLAFSCYVFNGDGKLLITRRALSKTAWPGVWTNSFCGHPAPNESFEDAIQRRAAFELGLELSDIEVALPDFSYRAVDASGVVENEFCPVYTATARVDPKPNPDEVAEYAWVELDDIFAKASAVPQILSPWMVLQLPLLASVE